MYPLRFKKEAELTKGEIYSVCLRGARRIEKDEFDLSIYTPEFWENPKYIADIVSQNQYKFSDILTGECFDNYDPEARNYNGLYIAMRVVYGAGPDGFDEREIVTILRFKIL